MRSSLPDCVSVSFAALAVLLAICTPFAGARAAETDQFLVWDVELEDSAPEINAWLQAELDAFLADVNDSEYLSGKDADALTVRFLRRVFWVRPIAGINELYNSPEIDVYPPRDDVNFFEYQRMSVYRGPAFPYLLFMARTVRVGEVYIGIDKLSHFFGYGRRYFKDYQRLDERGIEFNEIVERLVEDGLESEYRLTGRAINGITSLSDLEANYQGFRFARDMARGEEPLLAKREGRWIRTRPVDIVPYITPHMDESYYQPVYWAQRKAAVLPVIETEYAADYPSRTVRERFARYDDYPPSRNVQILDRLFDTKPGGPPDTQPVPIHADAGSIFDPPDLSE